MNRDPVFWILNMLCILIGAAMALVIQWLSR